jgi:hypothetical protein
MQDAAAGKSVYAPAHVPPSPIPVALQKVFQNKMKVILEYQNRTNLNFSKYTIPIEECLTKTLFFVKIKPAKLV